MTSRRQTPIARRPPAGAPALVVLLLLVLGVTTFAACVAVEADHHDDVPLDDGDIGVLRSAVNLGALGAGCSTAGTEGISAQLLDEMLCLTDGRFVRFAHANITLTSSRVHPYLSPAARSGIESAAATTPIRINSAFRTLAEQYVLWLGCPVAATPGNSNHESGRAVDVDNHAAARSALLAAGFTQPLPSSDPVHFEGPGEDLRSFSVLAFQRLWNANHPEDLIDEDGISGPQTRARLERSPAEGFAVGRICGAEPPSLEAELVRATADAAEDGTGAGDYLLCAGDPVTFGFELRNVGGAVWTDEGGAERGSAVRLGVPSDGRDPVTGTDRFSLADASNPVVRSAEAEPPGGDCNDAPGCRRTIFTLDGVAPDEVGIVRSTWRLVDEGREWFGPEMSLVFRVEDCAPVEPDADPGGDAGLDGGWVDDAGPDGGWVDDGGSSGDADLDGGVGRDGGSGFDLGGSSAMRGGCTSVDGTAVRTSRALASLVAAFFLVAP